MIGRPTDFILALVTVVAAGGSVGCTPVDSASGPAVQAVAPASPAPAAVRAPARRPLAGRVVVLDPGHQLGNHRFPAKIHRQVPAGGFRKDCNTTGTSTRSGYAEATFTWQVSRTIARRLERLGARVISTRQSNSQQRWGPCVNVRGRAGNKVGADLKLSIHADGSDAAGARGFHVIAPIDRKPWTHDIFAASRRFARITRASLQGKGLPYATYIAGGDGLDFRSDLATLNLSDIPTVMVELGNMRDAGDARRMRSSQGRQRYAEALVRAVRVGLRGT